MPQTIGGIIERARAELLDSQSPVRYTDIAVAGHVIDALRLINAMRPETRYAGIELSEPDYPVVTSDNIAAVKATNLPIDPRWEGAILYYIVGKCLETTSSDAANDARAQFQMAQFNALLKA